MGADPHRDHFDKSHPGFFSTRVLHTSNSVPDRIVSKTFPGFCPTGALHATNYVPDIIVISRPKIILLRTILVVLCTPERSMPWTALNKTNQKKGSPNLCPTDSLRFSIQTGIDRMVVHDQRSILGILTSPLRPNRFESEVLSKEQRSLGYFFT